MRTVLRAPSAPGANATSIVQTSPAVIVTLPLESTDVQSPSGDVAKSLESPPMPMMPLKVMVVAPVLVRVNCFTVKSPRVTLPKSSVVGEATTVDVVAAAGVLEAAPSTATGTAPRMTLAPAIAAHRRTRSHRCIGPTLHFRQLRDRPGQAATIADDHAVAVEPRTTASVSPPATRISRRTARKPARVTSASSASSCGSVMP